MAYTSCEERFTPARVPVPHPFLADTRGRILYIALPPEWERRQHQLTPCTRSAIRVQTVWACQPCTRTVVGESTGFRKTEEASKEPNYTTGWNDLGRTVVTRATSCMILRDRNLNRRASESSPGVASQASSWEDPQYVLF